MDNNENQAPVEQPKHESHAGKNTGMAILAYLGILIIIPFLTDAKKDPFVKFHMRQGLTLIVSEVVCMFIVIVPVLGWIAAPILWIFNFVMVILGIINAVSGKEKELPLIGKFAKSFNF